MLIHYLLHQPVVLEPTEARLSHGVGNTALTLAYFISLLFLQQNTLSYNYSSPIQPRFDLDNNILSVYSRWDVSHLGRSLQTLLHTPTPHKPFFIERSFSLVTLLLPQLPQSVDNVWVDIAFQQGWSGTEIHSNEKKRTERFQPFDSIIILPARVEWPWCKR